MRPLLAADPASVARRRAVRPLELPSASAQRVAAFEREAYERGFAQGERAGQDAARTRVEATLARLGSTIADLASLRSGLLRKSEQDLVRLAVAIAERIVRREIEIDRDVLVAMARAAIGRLGQGAVATIALHPDDLAAIRTEATDADAGGIRVVADSQVPSGGGLVTSSFGTIDVGLDAQIREVVAALLGGSDTPQWSPEGAGRDESVG